MKITKIILAKKTLFNLTLTSLILILSLPVIALKTDSQQHIQINSVKQSLDLIKNITTFTENVVLKQGSIDVRANKLIISRQNSNVKKIVVEAYGTPVTFYQLQDDGKPIKGHSDKIHYEMEKNLIVLTGNVYFEQLDSNIKADKITYLIQTQEIEAFSGKGRRVITTLLPFQLQEKSSNLKNTDNESK